MQTVLKLFDRQGLEVLPGEIIRPASGAIRKFISIIDSETIKVEAAERDRPYETPIDYWCDYHIREVPQFTGPLTPVYIQQVGRAERHTPLATALLLFFDAGYTAHRVFDHDRAIVRSVTFKSSGKIPLTAHVEVINGERFIRNSILKHAGLV